MLQHVRARAHYAHVAQQYVDELGQLVYVGLAHDVSPAGLAGVVLGGLQGVGLGVHLHGAELDAVEFLVVQSVPFLAEEHRSRHGDLSHDGYDDQDGDEQGAQEEQ